MVEKLVITYDEYSNLHELTRLFITEDELYPISHWFVEYGNESKDAVIRYAKKHFPELNLADT